MKSADKSKLPGTSFGHGPGIDLQSDSPVGEVVDAPPAREPKPISLTGRLVTVCPLDPAAHGHALYSASHGLGALSDRLWLYLSEGPFSSPQAFADYLHRNAASRDPLFFSIVSHRLAMAVGFASYLRIEPHHRVIEIGHVLFAPVLQKTAEATEAMYLMARHIFEDLGYRRYEWKCHALNRPSRAAAARLGFTYEGTFRQHMISKGRNRDTAWFSMLDHEWPQRKRAFERWLAVDNFDIDGHQKRRLADFVSCVAT